MELFIHSVCITLEKLKIQIKDFNLYKGFLPKENQIKHKYLPHSLLYRLFQVKWCIINNHT